MIQWHGLRREWFFFLLLSGLEVPGAGRGNLMGHVLRLRHIEISFVHALEALTWFRFTNICFFCVVRCLQLAAFYLGGGGPDGPAVRGRSTASRGRWAARPGPHRRCAAEGGSGGLGCAS